MNEPIEHDIKMTEFDYLITEPRIQMMKAALPLMAPAQQRIFSVFIKAQEMSKTMQVFEEGTVSMMSVSPTPSKSPSFFEILQTIKPYAGPRERELIDNFENIQLMMQVMQSNNESR